MWCDSPVFHHAVCTYTRSSSSPRCTSTQTPPSPYTLHPDVLVLSSSSVPAIVYVSTWVLSGTNATAPLTVAPSPSMVTFPVTKLGSA